MTTKQFIKRYLSKGSELIQIISEKSTELIVKIIFKDKIMKSPSTKDLLMQLVNDMSEVKKDMAEVKDRLTILETKVDNLETKVDNLETKVDNIDDRLKNLESEAKNHNWNI